MVCAAQELLADGIFSLKSYKKKIKFSHVTDRFLKFCRNGALFQLKETHFSKKWQMDPDVVCS